MQANTVRFSRLLSALILSIFLFSPARAGAILSNDPFVDQWYFQSIGAYKAWDYTTGSEDVIVAVLDNGFDHFHPDLRDNVWINKGEVPGNNADDDGNGYVDDVYGWDFTIVDKNANGKADTDELAGDNDPLPEVDNLTAEERKSHLFSHGTVVAGLIGAKGDNQKDGVGINWKVKLMNVKVLGNSGGGSFGLLDRAIRYAVDNGADILNISMVSDDLTAQMIEALKYAHERGVLVVASAGNDGADLNTKPLYPVCADRNRDDLMVIGASAVTEAHYIALFSNTGSACIDITAPGVSIASTLRYAPEAGLNDRFGRGWSGTSFAAPFISGTAALVKSARPEWKSTEIMNAILKTVRHTPGQDETVYANLFGAGLIQADRAVKYALGLDNGNKPTEPAAPEPTPEPEQTTTTETSTPKDTTPKQITDKSTTKHRLLAYQPKDGSVEEVDTLADTVFHYRRFVLRNIDALQSFRDEAGQLHYIVVRAAEAGKREVLILNEKWDKEHTWFIDAAGPLAAAVGNVVGTAEPEVILAPRSAGKQLFAIFSLTGTRLNERLLPAAHTGVAITVAKNAATGFDHVLALYEASPSRSMYVEQYDGTLSLIHQTVVPDYARGGSIAAGDIDGDQVDEFIIGSGAGRLSGLGYYELSGKIKRKFPGYNPAFTGGMLVNIFDYDNDGADDVIINAMDASQPVRVWNKRSQRLAEWYPFGEDFNGEFRIIPSF